MADNYVQRGDVIDAIAPSGGYTSGVPVALGVCVGIPQITGVQNDPVPCGIEGVYLLPLESGGSALSPGDQVNFLVSTGTITAVDSVVAGDINGVGIVARAAAGTDSHVEVKLTPGSGVIV